MGRVGMGAAAQNEPPTVAEARAQEAERTLVTRFRALDAHIQAMLRCARRSKGYPKDKCESRPIQLERNHLGRDLLCHLRGHDLKPAERKWGVALHAWRPINVSFVGEDGVDDTGLTIDAFAQAFRSLRSKHPGLFETAGDGQSGEWILPREDVAVKGGKPKLEIELPALIPNVPGGQIDSYEAWRLLGLLLAKVLILGDGVFIDDRLPDFVLEFLATDNIESLHTPEGAMHALAQCRSARAAECARRWLSTPCAEMAAHLLIEEADLTVFMLFDGHLPSCPHFRGWGTAEGANEGTGSGGSPTCRCHSTVLDDGNKWVHAGKAVYHDLYDLRRRHLRELKSGFLGEHYETEDERTCHDFSAHLALFTPHELGVRLRGVPVSDAEMLWGALKVRRQTRNEGRDGTQMLTVGEKAYEATKALLLLAPTLLPPRYPPPLPPTLTLP